MNSDDGKRSRDLSQEERVLWTTVTRSISPLRKTATHGGHAARSRAAFASESSASKTERGQPSAADRKMPPLVALGRRTRQRVGRGKEAIDGRLDLHGLTQHEAHTTLLRFLQTASHRDARLVLVITGKGAGNGERGILKRQVPQWLELPEFRKWVIGFENAHVAHGGDGALYVRVRRGKRS
jgi:DNA-nicking Smr family endonuclease